MSDPNPVEGQDFTVHMIVTDKNGGLFDLTGKSVTVSVRTPNNAVSINNTPLNIALATSTVSYKISKDVSVNGNWYLTVHIDDSIICNNPASVHFDKLLT